MDPLTEKRYSISPYAYCSGNPINRIDPDGMDDYILNRDGSTILALKTNDGNDKIYAVNKDGEIDKKNTIDLTKDVMSSKTTEQSTGNKGIDRFTSFNKSQADDYFRFVANNTDVEWSNTNVTYTNEDGNSNNFNTIATSHEYGTELSLTTSTLSSYESVNNSIIKHGKYEINSMDHSHTNGSTNPSGYYDEKTGGTKGGDVGVVSRINKLNGHNNATYNIYSPNYRQYYPYDANSTPWLLKGVEATAKKLMKTAKP